MTRQVGPVALVGGAQAVDEVGEARSALDRLVLADDAAHVEAVAGPVEGVLGVPAGGVVAHPRDGGGGLAVADRLLVEGVGVLGVAGDGGAVVGDARDDDGGVVGRVGVAVADRHGAVAAEGARLVDDQVDVDRVGDAVTVEVRQPVGGRDVEGGLRGVGPVEQPLLRLGEVLAGVLLGGEAVEVAVQRGAVGLVAVAGRDAVGVADEVGVADLQRLLLGAGQPLPPVVDRVRVAAEGGELGCAGRRRRWCRGRRRRRPRRWCRRPGRRR